MFARVAVSSAFGRTAVIATVAAVTLTAVAPPPALAGFALSGKGLSVVAARSGVAEVSARRRLHRAGGGAAAAAAFAGIVGAGLAIAAAQSRRAYYDDYYGYYGGPAYYGYGPYAYYGGGPYYPYYYGGYRSGVPTFRGHPLADW
jgi:hypothetical protein